MGTSAFQAGTEVVIEGTAYLLVRKLAGDIWQTENIRTKRIEERTDRDLRTLYGSGKLIFARTDNLPQRAGRAVTPVVIPPHLWETAKSRRAYVTAVLDIPNTRSQLVPLIRETWERLGSHGALPNPATVMRWKARYLKFGQDITGLVDLNKRKGNRSERYPNDVLAMVERTIEAVYLAPERRTLQDVVDQASAEVERENRLRPQSLQAPFPTRRLVKRLVSSIPKFDVYAARHGRMAAVKRFRSVQGHRTTKAPLERAEIDHTQLDLMVIDEASGLPLGRPWVTCCIDDYSRCILGIHVGFEPPSYLTVAHCLRDAFRPKDSLRETYPSIQNDWAAHGVMRELVVDNGVEFHSASLENACFTLGIEIHYSARKTPWFKGKIERFLGTLNAAVAHGRPGTTFGNIFEKEDYDPSKHAVVRLSKLQEVIRMWISDVYHQKPHRTLNATPADVWNTAISPEQIFLPDDPEELTALLGRSDRRCLTHKGIELEGLLYNSPDLTALRMKLGDRLDVDIRVDDSNLGRIFVIAPDDGQLLTATALVAHYAEGLSRWQHAVCRKFARQQWERNDQRGWIQAKAKIAELIDEEFMHKKRKTRTRIARFKAHQPPAPAVAAMEALPLPAPASQSTPETPAEPLTAADMAAPSGTAPSTRRFAPITRDRLAKYIEADQEESLKENCNG